MREWLDGMSARKGDDSTALVISGASSVCDARAARLDRCVWMTVDPFMDHPPARVDSARRDGEAIDNLVAGRIIDGAEQHAQPSSGETERGSRFGIGASLAKPPGSAAPPGERLYSF